jgi:hypothetical protein
VLSPERLRRWAIEQLALNLAGSCPRLKPSGYPAQAPRIQLRLCVSRVARASELRRPSRAIRRPSLAVSLSNAPRRFPPDSRGADCTWGRRFWRTDRHDRAGRSTRPCRRSGEACRYGAGGRGRARNCDTEMDCGSQTYPSLADSLASTLADLKRVRGKGRLDKAAYVAPFLHQVLGQVRLYVRCSAMEPQGPLRRPPDRPSWHRCSWRLFAHEGLTSVRSVFKHQRSRSYVLIL